MPLAGEEILITDFEGDVYALETANDTTTSTSYVDGTLHGVAFVPPTSGSVWIGFGGLVGNNSTSEGLRTLMSDYVRTGSTIGSGTDVLTPSDARAIKLYKQTTNSSYMYAQASIWHKVTGLTAGADYNVITQFRAVSDTAAVDDRWVAVIPAFT
ncbi:hypothetical protein QTQ03_25260 [Micromonospora sp. WMMA1363]|uniref:hypothetical protein n=1 Tax=Micromonospora sp. WMMA1363 TaxID=3053985 RepID=UPI00259CC54A|nr:hypothetical protein [Micromonospora sp. WMMA1363]MDM4721163.1 hypothetical protein [Micromonospora sp. WMMA1363]MDM4722744.1 hypothetical protein [Micromonospora sp. WMMA1363]